MDVNVSLAPLDSTDLGLLRSWRNNYDIWKWCRQCDLISDAEQVRWFNRQTEDPSIKMYKIMTKAGDKAPVPVGACGLTSIDFINRRAEFSIYIAPDLMGNGMGKVGLALLLDHGFKNLGLNLIWGECFDGNPALKTFLELGFKREGVRRQFYFRDGEFIAAHLISLTAKEWKHARDRNDSEFSANNSASSGGSSKQTGSEDRPDSADKQQEDNSEKGGIAV